MVRGVISSYLAGLCLFDLIMPHLLYLADLTDDGEGWGQVFYFYPLPWFTYTYIQNQDFQSKLHPQIH